MSDIVYSVVNCHN